MELKTKTGYIHRWWDHTAMDLWKLWSADYADEETAIAHAIWQVRCQIQGKKRSSQLKYVSIRDLFVKRHLNHCHGKQLGMVVEKCWLCEGSGIEPGRKRVRCTKCGGSKVYKTYPLYIVEFRVGEKILRLNSKVAPRFLYPDMSSEEWFEVDLPPTLPFGAILRVLSYVAKAKWNAQFKKNMYIERIPYVKKANRVAEETA